ncbi:MAG: hypothetical protein QXX35_05300 [Desulfurococcaceae archaeon]
MHETNNVKENDRLVLINIAIRRNCSNCLLNRLCSLLKKLRSK